MIERAALRCRRVGDDDDGDGDGDAPRFVEGGNGPAGVGALELLCLRTIDEVTPPALIAAFAALAWPPARPARASGAHRVAHALLRNVGAVTSLHIGVLIDQVMRCSSEMRSRTPVPRARCLSIPSWPAAPRPRRAIVVALALSDGARARPRRARHAVDSDE